MVRLRSPSILSAGRRIDFFVFFSRFAGFRCIIFLLMLNLGKKANFASATKHWWTGAPKICLFAGSQALCGRGFASRLRGIF